MRTVYVFATSAALGFLLAQLDVVPATTDRKKPLSFSTSRHGFLKSSPSLFPDLPSPTFRPPTSTTGPCVHTLYTNATPPGSVFEATIANRT